MDDTTGKTDVTKDERPRVLVATGPLSFTPLQQVMDATAEAGFSEVEVMIGQTSDTQSAERIKEIAKKSGVSVTAIHGPFLLLLRNVFGASFATKVTESMELAADVGAEVMVAHAPFRWEWRARKWLENSVRDLEKQTGVMFGMENLYPVAGQAFSSVITINDMDNFDHLVMDTSHCAVSGIDLFEMWRALSHKIVHLHVSDNYGHGSDSHAPLGSGVLPVEAFLAEVGASDWTGTVTLELDCRQYLDTPASLVQFLARERVKTEAALAGEFNP